MKTLKVNSILVLISLFFMTACNQQQILFEENSEKWEAYGSATWSFLNNELLGKVNNGAGFVITKKQYKNFVLELEFKPDSIINSGVFIRCKKQDINPTDCYELNIWDLHPDQNNRTGAIVTREIPLEKVETINKWNTYKVKAQNNHIQVWINQVLTIDTKNNDLIEGHIGLQAKGNGKVIFKNVKIKTIK